LRARHLEAMATERLEEDAADGVELLGGGAALGLPSKPARRGGPGRGAPAAAGRRWRRQEEPRRPLALHHPAALVGEQGARPVASGEAPPAGGHAPAQQAEYPLGRVLPEIAPGLHAGEAGLRQPGVVVAVHESDGRAEPEATVDAGHTGEGLA